MPPSRQERSVASLVTSVGFAAGVLGIIVGTLILHRFAKSWLTRDADARLAAASQRTSRLISLYLRDRRETLVSLASSPTTAAAARGGAALAGSRGLPLRTSAELERDFQATRSLDADPAASAWLRRLTQTGDFSELFITESHGFVVAQSGRTSDFVQSDEEWWQRAARGTSWLGEATYDSSAGIISAEIATPVQSDGGGVIGVVKGVMDLRRLQAITAAADSTIETDVVDRLGRIVIGPQASLLQRPSWTVPVARGDSVVFGAIGEGRQRERVALVPVAGTSWRVVVRSPESRLYAPVALAQRTIIIAGLVLLAALAAGISAAGNWLQRGLTRPVARLAETARSVAQGNLSQDVELAAGTAEAMALSQALSDMVSALRRLVGAIRSASDEAAAMAAEISASTEQMAAAGEEMANTTQDLTRRAQEQSDGVRAAAGDTQRIVTIARQLAGTARDAAERNAALAALSAKHRRQLEASGVTLDRMAGDVEQGATEARALMEASRQISRFVTQTKAIATQTNMLALNAAIEASRAGESGKGFGVVADEVRKLAVQAAQAAATTEGTVQQVLTRVKATADTMTRAAAGSSEARQAAREAVEGLGKVATAAAENDRWSTEISAAAQESEALVGDIAKRLAEVSGSTESFVASAEEIAASSQQQTATTQEIAASAQALAAAADRLGAAVQSFRLRKD